MKKTPKNTRNEAPAAVEQFRANRTSREDTYEIGESRIRITQGQSGIAVAIDDRQINPDGEKWSFRKGSAVFCARLAEAETIGAALFVSEQIRQSR